MKGEINMFSNKKWYLLSLVLIIVQLYKGKSKVNG